MSKSYNTQTKLLKCLSMIIPSPSKLIIVSLPISVEIRLKSLITFPHLTVSFMKTTNKVKGRYGIIKTIESLC